MRQKGFTLIEVMVAMAVGGIVMAGVVLGIYQVVWGTARSSDQVVALTDINHAALYIKKDLQMVQRTSLTDGEPTPQSSANLSWTDYTGFEPEDERNHFSAYVLSGTDLMRTYDGTVSIVGRYITSIGFTQDGRVITVVITATAPGISERNETLEFSVKMRPEEIQ